MEFPVAPHAHGGVIAITVIPRGSSNLIEQAPDGSLRIRVTAPPVEGAANAAVLRLLAKALDVPRTHLEIVSGASGRRKTILVTGTRPQEIETRLRRATTARL